MTLHPMPSKILHSVLSGDTALADAPASVQSWARLEIHNAAVHVLSLPKEKRDEFLERIPLDLRELVKAEANRVWRWRRDQ